jgi:hypothetical protein
MPCLPYIVAGNHGQGENSQRGTDEQSGAGKSKDVTTAASYVDAVSDLLEVDKFRKMLKALKNDQKGGF